RVKLAAHLSQGRSAMGRAANNGAAKAGSRVLYILDEPTTGLHFDDVSKLLTAFKRLIDAGGSLVVIEHNLDVIKSADWVIDLGPEAGAGGGRVIAEGTPEQIVQTPGSHTGSWLGQALAAQEVRAGQGLQVAAGTSRRCLSWCWRPSPWRRTSFLREPRPRTP